MDQPSSLAAPLLKEPNKQQFTQLAPAAPLLRIMQAPRTEALYPQRPL